MGLGIRLRFFLHLRSRFFSRRHFLLFVRHTGNKLSRFVCRNNWGSGGCDYRGFSRQHRGRFGGTYPKHELAPFLRKTPGFALVAQNYTQLYIRAGLPDFYRGNIGRTQSFIRIPLNHRIFQRNRYRMGRGLLRGEFKVFLCFKDQ